MEFSGNLHGRLDGPPHPPARRAAVRHLRRWVEVVKAATVLAVLAVVGIAAVRGAAGGPGDAGATTLDAHGYHRAATAPASSGGAGAQTKTRAALGRACPAGAPRATTALVRTPAGRVQVVPFDRGWEVYTGQAPGTLVRVCVAEGR